MKVTKSQLRQIIKEEKATLLNEQGDRIADELLGDFLRDMAQDLKKARMTTGSTITTLR